MTGWTGGEATTQSLFAEAAGASSRAPVWRRVMRRAVPTDREGVIAWGLVAFAAVFNFYFLHPEVAIHAHKLNDGVLHMMALRGMVDAMRSGRDPTDFWFAPVTTGFPLFHHYQHFPFLPPAVLYLALREAVGLTTIFDWTQYLLLSLFPFSVYWAMGRFGFPRLTAALAGTVAPLISTNGLYGFDDVSYVWYGFGLYTQLWGMILLPPALACGYTAIRDGRGYFLAVLLLSATLLSHLVLAYIGLSSLVLLALLMPPRPALRVRLGRLALVLGLTALVTSYFLVPFIRDGAYMNRGVWELQTKYDAFGYEWTLRALFGGRLFDYGRFPSLSLLLAAGLAVCVWRWRDAHYRVPLLLGALWLALYFGRPTWGVLLNLLPLSENMQFHRLIAGVHLAGIMLAGIALGIPWRWAVERRNARWVVAVAAVTALVLAPAYIERRHYLEKNANGLRVSAAQYSAEERDINALQARLRALPPGRVYAGRGANWGGDYRVGSVPMDALLSSAGFDMTGYLYHSLSFNADELILFDESRPEQYNLFNVRYVVAPASHSFPGFVTPIADFGRHRLYRVDTTGYFDIVGSDVTFTGDKSDVFRAASSWMASDLPAKKEHPAVSLDGRGGQTFDLTRSPEVLSQMSFDAGPSRGRIVTERIEGNIYAASVDIARPSMIMLKATFHPGWHATVDGIPVKTVMLMPSYVAVPVRPGTHNIRFEYRPPSARLPLLVFGLAFLPVIGVAEWRRRELVDFTTRRLPWRSIRLPGSPPKGRARGDALIAAAGSGGRARASRRTLLGIYLLFLALYLTGASGHFYSTDHVAVYLTTQSLVEDHDLSIKPILNTGKGRNGASFANYGIGQAVAAIPFYAAGRAVDNGASGRVNRYFSGTNIGDWGGTTPIFFVSLFNQFVAPLICVMVFLFLLEFGFAPRTSLLATLLFGFGSAVFVAAHEFFQHPLETFFLLSAIYVLFANRRDLGSGQAALAGALLGLGIVTRINVAIVGPAIVVYLIAIALPARTPDDEEYGARASGVSAARLRSLTALRRIDASVVRNVCAFLVPILAAGAVVLWVNYLRYEDVLTMSRNAPGAEGNDVTPGTAIVGIYAYLFSPGRSVFLYSPPLLLALFGWRRFYQLHRAEALLFGTIACTYLVSYGAQDIWHGGWSWGPRYLLAVVPLLFMPAAYVLERPRALVPAALLGIVGFGVQILGTAVNVSYTIFAHSNGVLVTNTLFAPGTSPIRYHLQDLLDNRNVDLWLLFVRHEFGTGAMLATLAAPVTTLAAGIALLLPGVVSRHWPETPVARQREGVSERSIGG